MLALEATNITMKNDHHTDHDPRLAELLEGVPPGRAAAAREAAMAEAAHDLTQCGACGSPLVQPIDWLDAGRHHWRLLLRCPNCEACGTVVVEDELVDFYDVELERGAAALARSLSDLVQERIGREVAQFSEALRRDLILPEDF
jgi:hypothetical protein